MNLIVLWLTNDSHLLGWEKVASGPEEFLRELGTSIAQKASKDPASSPDFPAGSQVGEYKLANDEELEILANKGFKAWLAYEAPSVTVAELTLTPPLES